MKTTHDDSVERFSVSTEGMAQLHRDREPWYLVKELVANAWDENADTDVSIEYSSDADNLTISVKDSGSGFENIQDAYTLMRPTPKRGKPDVRGRFNVGEKEIFSIAKTGFVETVGFTVTFPEDGGRIVTENEITSGTTVSVTVDGWGEKDADDISTMLSLFAPPEGISYTVNGQIIEPVKPDYVVLRKLESVIQSAPNQPLRRTFRNTDVEISSTLPNDGWLYEMGIPIQEINCPFNVNICQKVPLSQNRDAAPERYLRDIYAIVLNATYKMIDEDQASRGWVMAATEDDITTDEAVLQVFETRFGKGAVIKSKWDTEANERAVEDGKMLVSVSALSGAEKARFKNAGAPEAHGKYGLEGASVKITPVKKVTAGMEQVKSYAKWLAIETIEHDISVEFIRTDKHILADYNFMTQTLRFNVRRLTGASKWFDGGIAPKHTSLILHELAHDCAARDLAHHGAYVHFLSEISAKAVHKALGLGEKNWGGDEQVLVEASQQQ